MLTPTISCSHILIIHTAVISHKFHALRSPYWRRQQQKKTHWGWIMRLNVCVWQMSAQSQSKVTEWMNGWGKCVKKFVQDSCICGTKWYMCERESSKWGFTLSITLCLMTDISGIYLSVLGQSYIIYTFGFILNEMEREREKKRKWEGKKEHNLFIEDTFMK